MKLLFAGPVGAGKSTAIRAISDTPPISTDVPWSDAVAGGKTTTTVAFDYSSIRLDEHSTLHLYGLPGQEQFNFMSAVIAPGAIGVVLLLDGSSSEVVQDGVHQVRRMKRLFPGLQCVIGVAKTDLSPHFSLGELYQAVLTEGCNAPIFTIDPRNRGEVTQLVRALLMLVG
ncbi:ATP/GTP-binding protein [Dyella sp. LX-66]|uniref:GTP-binding protein n=1 Tax=unclassified Dyella TaxID=2634549 RepID=UPI001BE0F8DC|nr:ATP/GTP-binding protein [Dyella sp. LX-1]MBT2138914.1 ATP/GTP-binding protein [Dyella sp. LX-66]